MTPLEELEAAAPMASLDGRTDGGWDCSGHVVHKHDNPANPEDTWSIYGGPGILGGKYPTASDLVFAHPGVFGVKLPPLYNGIVTSWPLNVTTKWDPNSTGVYRNPYNAWSDVLVRPLDAPLSAWIDNMRVTKPTLIQWGFSLAVRTDAQDSEVTKPDPRIAELEAKLGRTESWLAEVKKDKARLEVQLYVLKEEQAKSPLPSLEIREFNAVKKDLRRWVFDLQAERSKWRSEHADLASGKAVAEANLAELEAKFQALKAKQAKPSLPSHLLGTKVWDAVTGEGPQFVLPIDPDHVGRLSVFSGDYDENGSQVGRAAWAAALTPREPPTVALRVALYVLCACSITLSAAAGHWLLTSLWSLGQGVAW